MLISTVRIKGEHDSWWDNVVRLLSGRGVRRDPPEQLAVARSIRMLEAALSKAGADVSRTPVNVAISHDGAGEDRAATVVTFANLNHQETSSPLASVNPPPPPTTADT